MLPVSLDGLEELYDAFRCYFRLSVWDPRFLERVSIFSKSPNMSVHHLSLSGLLSHGLYERFRWLESRFKTGVTGASPPTVTSMGGSFYLGGLVQGRRP
jgi:hypothetical protein